MQRVSTMVSGLLLLSFAGTAQAGLVVYDDRADWRADAGGGIGDLTEDFDSLTGPDLLYGAAPVTQGFVTLSVEGGSGGGDNGDNSWRVDVLPATFSSIPAVDGSNFATTLAFPESLSGFGSTQLGFAAVSALGLDLANGSYTSGASELVLTTSLGDSIAVTLPSANASRFIGLRYMDGSIFDSVQFGVAGGAIGAGIDNLEAFSGTSAAGPTGVPAPQSGWLLGLGLLSLARRRKRG